MSLFQWTPLCSRVEKIYLSCLQVWPSVALPDHNIAILIAIVQGRWLLFSCFLFFPGSRCGKPPIHHDSLPFFRRLFPFSLLVHVPYPCSPCLYVTLQISGLQLKVLVSQHRTRQSVAQFATYPSAGLSTRGRGRWFSSSTLRRRPTVSRFSQAANCFASGRLLLLENLHPFKPRPWD